jgi:hypothetical protein
MVFDTAFFLSDVPLFVIMVIVLSHYLLRDYHFND